MKPPVRDFSPFDDGDPSEVDAIQQAVYPNLSAANDPVRAEGRCGSAPNGHYDAPGTSLTAHADPSKTDAVGAVNGAEQPAQKSSYGSTRSHSTSQLEGSPASTE